jgi:hypothetical protein
MDICILGVLSDTRLCFHLCSMIKHTYFIIFSYIRVCALKCLWLCYGLYSAMCYRALFTQNKSYNNILKFGTPYMEPVHVK